MWSIYGARTAGVGGHFGGPYTVFELNPERAGIVAAGAYRVLFREALDGEFLDDLRAATNGGWPLGGDRFKDRIVAKASRRATPLAP